MLVGPITCLLTFLQATQISSINLSQINKQILMSSECDLSKAVLVLSIIPDSVKCRALCAREPDCTSYSVHVDRCYLRPSPGKEGVMYMGKYDDTCPVYKGFVSVFEPRLCYKLSRGKIAWRRAWKKCKSERGRLMVLSDEKIFDYMRRLLMSDTETNHWVGMRKIHGKLKWIDRSSHVKKWQNKEPDYVNYQNCGSFHVSPEETFDGMSDDDCADSLKYICEIQTAD